MTYAIIIFGALLLFTIFLFNNLIAKKNKVHEAYSSIDVMLKKRTDLIPRLVNTVKGYMEHERATLTEITQLREKVMAENVQPTARFNLESQLGTLLEKVQLRSEAYPDLKSNENFLMLQASLNEVEEQLSAARRAYNAAVNTFNNTLEMFPSNIMGKMMGYSQKELFTIETEDKEAPHINF
ncbi:LemA family protein [Flagellimonas amoyensis]|uniref:LemA family protein n=1 Tax=Flagellimonas amoyensis TaxID=2169401 RepID=UPI000D3CC09A|nr:LemA family protein [Allomuricauda amoyensis]